MNQPVADLLPVSKRLPDRFSLDQAFMKLAHRPGCLWLDSASLGPVDGDGQSMGRYSFLTSDPVKQIVASEGDQDPWPDLARCYRDLPHDFDPELPPFQGGIAGLIGYEAAGWLDSVGRAPQNDLPVPAMSVGLYDWTLATDHQTGRSWIIAQGIGDPAIADNRVDRVALAKQRIAEVMAWLDAPVIHPAKAVGDTQLDAAPESAQSCQANLGVPTDHPGVTSNFTRDHFCEAVADIIHRIGNGDSFQVNLAQRLLRRSDCPPETLYRRLRQSNPAPFGAFYHGGSFAVMSSSPEGFLKVRDRRVQTRPIKGTVRRTRHEDIDLMLAQKLSASEKDRAENVMIVDLMRNDLSRVCQDDSVVVSKLCQVERYEFVQHLVSVVEGVLRDDLDDVDLLMACFPGGSITGAPKVEAMRTIAELERHPRGAYCGSIGYLGCGRRSDWNILIRTITAAHGYWQFPVGGGITARSDPESEEYETWSKAEGMLRAMR